MTFNEGPYAEVDLSSVRPELDFKDDFFKKIWYKITYLFMA